MSYHLSLPNLTASINIMTFEQNFRAFLTAAYDGNKRDFSTVEHLFNAVYHDEYVQMNEDTTLTKEMMKLHSNLITMGTLVYDIEVKADGNKTFPSNSVEFKFRVTNDKFDVTVHESGELKDGKLIESKSLLDKKSLDAMLKARAYIFVENMVRNLHEYEKVENDTTSTLEDAERVFERLFHDEFEAKLEGGGFGRMDAEEFGGKTLTKEELKLIKEEDFICAKKITVDKIRIIDNKHVEIVVSKEDEWRRHQILTVKDGKIITIESVKNSVHNLVHGLNKYIKLQNSSDSTLEDINKVFDRNFHDDLVAEVEGHGAGLGKEDARKIVFQDFVDKAKLTFEMIRVLDDHRLEVIISKKEDWRRHQILTVKDGKIVGIETIADADNATPTTYCKLNQGDDLIQACMNFNVTAE